MVRKIAVAVFVLVLIAVIWIKWCNRPSNGIHGLGKNVCLIEGECIMINWDATEREAELALDRWHQLRQIERR